MASISVGQTIPQQQQQEQQNQCAFQVLAYLQGLPMSQVSILESRFHSQWTKHKSLWPEGDAKIVCYPKGAFQSLASVFRVILTDEIVYDGSFFIESLLKTIIISGAAAIKPKVSLGEFVLTVLQKASPRHFSSPQEMILIGLLPEPLRSSTSRPFLTIGAGLQLVDWTTYQLPISIPASTSRLILSGVCFVESGNHFTYCKREQTHWTLYNSRATAYPVRHTLPCVSGTITDPRNALFIALSLISI